MPAPRPNILFVMTDDHTEREIGAYGNPLIHTPHLDRLAATGTRFQNAFCTNALCAPARATVLTGAYSHVHGIYGNSEEADAVETLDPKVATFPELLHNAGYQTGLVGKYHIRQDPRGFDYWCIHPGQGEYFDPVFIENGAQIQKQGYATDITADLALDYLERRDRTRPFCLVYQFKAPHRPFTPAPRHGDLYAEIEIPKPASYDDDYATRRIAAEAADMRFDISLASDYDDLPADLDAAGRREWIYQRYTRDRYRTITGVDENLGRVLDYLDDEGLADDTLVIYTSDHGYFIGEHGWYDKRFMYEPCLRIPLLARYPRRGKAGHVAEESIVNIDYAATILDLAGIAAPATVQGASFAPLLQGQSPTDWRRATYYAYYEDSWRLHGRGDEAMAEPYRYFTPHRIGPHRGVRTDRYKLIEYYGEGDYWEFFDLREDPDELHNRYDDPQFAKRVAELKEELYGLRRHYGDLP